MFTRQIQCHLTRVIQVTPRWEFCLKGFSFVSARVWGRDGGGGGGGGGGAAARLRSFTRLNLTFLFKILPNPPPSAS